MQRFQDISGWQFNGLLILNSTFRNASRFDQNVGGWDVSGVLNFTDMFVGSAFSTLNYEKLLIGWVAQDLQSGKTLTVPAKYCSATAQAAKERITSGNRWTINDGGRCNGLIITSNGGRGVATIEVVEGETFVTTLVSISRNPSNILYSLSRADHLSFTIDVITGDLVFNTIPDFEMPASSTTPPSNEYTVAVTAIAGTANLFTATQVLTIRVTDVNEVPTAHAGDDQTVDENAKVTLTAAGSTDPEMEMLTYAWTQTGGVSST